MGKSEDGEDDSEREPLSTGMQENKSQQSSSNEEASPPGHRRLASLGSFEYQITPTLQGSLP